MFTESSMECCYKSRAYIGVGVFGMKMKEAFSSNLADWIEITGRKKSWVAAQLGVANSVITSWLDQSALPGKEDHFCKLAELMGLPDVSLLFLKGSVRTPAEAVKDLASKVK